MKTKKKDVARKYLVSICKAKTSYECVRKYTCLYDKSSESYKDKHRMDNVWREFIKELGFEAGAKAVAQTCSVKKVFLEIPQNSQENSCARVGSFITFDLNKETYLR